MTKQVKGFLADDGTFFVNQSEARRHDAEQTIIELCESHNIEAGRFVELIRRWAYVIKEYIDADKATQQANQHCNHARPEPEAYSEQADARADQRPTNQELRDAEPDQADDEDGTDHAQTLLEQSLGGSEPLSDVGSDTYAEAIRHQGASYGVGGGGSDASGLRSDQVLATRESPEAAEARSSRSTSGFRKATVERD